MTKSDVINQLYSLSHDFDGKKGLPKKWLKDFVDSSFNSDSVDNAYSTIVLPDGEWFFEIYKNKYGWNYFIPETREQEAFLFLEICEKKG